MFENEERKFKAVYLPLEEIIEEIKIILLTKQALQEDKLNILYTRLIEFSQSIECEKMIPREVTNLLFQFYLTAHTEMAFIDPQEGALRLFIPYLQKYIGNIFKG